MEEIIRTNMDSLVNNTDYEILLQKCIDKGVISMKMKKYIDLHETTNEKHQALFVKIIALQRFSKLAEICREHFKQAALILEPDNASDIEYYTKRGELSPLTPEQCSKLPRFVHINQPDDKTDLIQSSAYLEEDYAGVLFFVNYSDNRPYANVEREWLLSLFHQLNFRIFYLEDQNIEQIHSSIITLKRLYLRKVNCFFYIQLGAGTLNDVYFNDNIMIKVSSIIDSFNNKNCSTLLYKQKVFIFPSVSKAYINNKCNEFTFEFGVTQDCNKSLQIQTIKLAKNEPTRSNNLYFHFEHDNGSFEESIKIFCRLVAEYAYHEPFQNILKMYFQERKHAEHSDFREIVDEGCQIPFNIPYVVHTT